MSALVRRIPVRRSVSRNHAGHRVELSVVAGEADPNFLGQGRARWAQVVGCLGYCP